MFHTKLTKLPYIDHFAVKNDHINLSVVWNKADQNGTKGQTIMPMFGNPGNWRVCPLVATCVTFLSMDRISDQMDIFAEKCLDTMLNEWLRELQKEESPGQLINFAGKVLTGHGTRKGAPSHCVSQAGICNTSPNPV